MIATLPLCAAIPCLFALASSHTHAQAVLAFELNNLNNDTTGDLETGYTSALIGSVTSAGAVQQTEFTTPVVWMTVTGLAISVNGNTITATFPRPPGVQIFFRVRN